MLRREAVAGAGNMAVGSMESQVQVAKLSKGENAVKKHREESR